MARLAREYGEVITEHVERNAALAELNPHVSIYAGVARVQHGPMTKPEHFSAMAKLCAALARVG